MKTILELSKELGNLINTTFPLIKLDTRPEFTDDGYVEEIHKKEEQIVSASPFLACKTCHTKAFASMEEKRIHAQSEWHIENVKRREKLKQPLSKEEHEYEYKCTSDSENEDTDEQIMHIGSPWCVLTIQFSNESKCDSFKIYREVLMNRDRFEQLSSRVYEGNDIAMNIVNLIHSYWCIILCRSGAMAAAIFDPVTCKMICHKVLKRYTSRRKQGGSQMIRDKSGIVARSAGSQLRRENEKIWIQDIKELFKTWSNTLKGCHLVFISTSYYLRSLFYETIFSYKENDRMRSIPFTTFEPTMIEIQRCFDEIIRLDPIN